MTRALVALLVVWGLWLGEAPLEIRTGAQQAVFRSAVDSVLVNVSVRERGRLVTDLSAADFEVSDNGLRQSLTDVAQEPVPIDLTYLLDLSGSVSGPLLDALTRGVRTVQQQLRPDDRSGLVTFNHRIHEVRPLGSGREAAFQLDRPAGQTSVLDALTATLIGPAEPGRRRMVMLFTDGRDVTSFVEPTAVLDVARRADAAVFTVALAPGTTRSPQRAAHEPLFRSLSDITGGALTVLQSDRDLGASFLQAFDEFRTSYVLRYTYEGPRQEGWHTLGVRVTRRGSYEVRAREGYFSRARD